jgi:hypothetical protein
MDSINFVYVYLSQLVVHLPIIIVCAVGIYFSITKARNNSKIAVISGISFLVLLLLSLFTSAIPLISLFLSYSGNLNSTAIGYVYFAINIIVSITTTVCFALLLTAIWKDRK